MLLSKDQILSAVDLPTRDVAVPEWGGTVRVRTMTGAERDEFEQLSIEARGTDVTTNRRNIRARLVAMCAINDVGARMFTADDIEALGGKSARALDRVFDVASRLNRLSQDDVDDLAKNSVPAPDTASGSDSPGNSGA